MRVNVQFVRITRSLDMVDGIYRSMRSGVSVNSNSSSYSILHYVLLGMANTFAVWLSFHPKACSKFWSLNKTITGLQGEFRIGTRLWLFRSKQLFCLWEVIF